jgi:hypothetical protein
MVGRIKRGNGSWKDLSYEWVVYRLHIQIVISGEREPLLTNDEINEIRDIAKMSSDLAPYAMNRPILVRDNFSDDPKEGGNK